MQYSFLCCTLCEGVYWIVAITTNLLTLRLGCNVECLHMISGETHTKAPPDKRLILCSKTFLFVAADWAITNNSLLTITLSSKKLKHSH